MSATGQGTGTATGCQNESENGRGKGRFGTVLLRPFATGIGLHTSNGARVTGRRSKISWKIEIEMQFGDVDRRKWRSIGKLS